MAAERGTGVAPAWPPSDGACLQQAPRIGRRPPVDVDLPEMFRVCARTGTALETT
jgi:hypothetical protein